MARGRPTRGLRLVKARPYSQKKTGPPVITLSLADHPRHKRNPCFTSFCNSQRANSTVPFNCNARRRRITRACQFKQSEQPAQDSLSPLSSASKLFIQPQLETTKRLGFDICQEKWKADRSNSYGRLHARVPLSLEHVKGCQALSCDHC